MSDDLWWPGIPGQNDDPAFQVRRTTYGATEGGDYVRGSGAQVMGTLSGAGTALPTATFVGETWMLGSPVPTAAPNPVTGREPPGPLEPDKAEGQVIRWNGTAWENLGLIPTVHRSAVRYSTTVPGYTAVSGKAYLTITWRGHQTVTVNLPPDSQNFFPRQIQQPIGVSEIAWGWPNDEKSTWYEVALVRSGFGHPVTPTDGVTVFRANRQAFLDADGVITPPPVVMDRPLQVGKYYYYSLFFRTTQLDWVIGMTESILIPRDFKHAEHLWNALPPYYQYTDDNQKVSTSAKKSDAGPLAKYLSLFGAELDLTREYVEQWQNVYCADKSPMSLLRKVGDNFGLPYKAAVGDVRYRSMIAALPQLLLIRGTLPALQSVIEAGSKWQASVTLGANLMLTTDDSTFRKGTGNWGTQHTGAGVSWEYLTAPEVILTSGNTSSAPYGEKSMRVATVKSRETSSFGISCGCMFMVDEDGQTVGVYPRSAGIPVRGGYQYGFTVQVYAEAAVNVRIALLWFTKNGYPTDYIFKSEKTSEAATPGAWKTFYHQGIAPDTTTYLCPALYFESRAGVAPPERSAFIDIAGALVYLIDQVSSPKEYISPDKYLTLGDPEEKMGILKPGEEDSTGFIIGNPRAT